MKDVFRVRRMWRPRSELKSRYDVVIIGGGSHGLATAYYLAKNHAIRRVAVLEKGWIGGGNSGRNTTIVRSNYYYPQSARLYDFSLSLYESLGRELNYNIMLSQRGQIQLAHSEHELEILRRTCNAILMNGVDAEMMSPAAIKHLAPALELKAPGHFAACHYAAADAVAA